MKKNKITREQLLQEIADLKRHQLTLHMSTTSADNILLSSYAPFIEDENGQFYLLLSQLAGHSSNLMHHQHSHRPVSVQIIEDEQDSRNIFARRRLNYLCDVSFLSKDDDRAKSITRAMKLRFDQTVDLLLSLPDFNFFCLTPIHGSYVKGFGQAYTLADARMPVLS